VIRFERGDGPVWINPHQVLAVRDGKQQWTAIVDGKPEPRSSVGAYVDMYGTTATIFLPRDPAEVAALIQEALDG
jgi:hypothetical protein